MSVYLARDDARRGAPTAVCGPGEAMLRLAPESCTSVAGAVPPEYSFDRFDYQWLALCLSTSEEVTVLAHPLDGVCFGTHAPTWAAMHSIILRAAVSGFDVSRPSDLSLIHI